MVARALLRTRRYRRLRHGPLSTLPSGTWKGSGAASRCGGLLGGHRREVPAYAGGIDLYFTLDALREQAQGFMERGFGAIKMKVGRDRLSEDVERVAAIRDLVGPELPFDGGREHALAGA